MLILAWYSFHKDLLYLLNEVGSLSKWLINIGLYAVKLFKEYIYAGLSYVMCIDCFRTFSSMGRMNASRLVLI